MTPDIKNGKHFLKPTPMVRAFVGERVVTVLGLEAEKLGKSTPGIALEPSLLPFFRHSLVEIVMVADLNSGGISTRTQTMKNGSTVGQERLIYWDRRFAGVEANSENMARFLGEAARQLDAHDMVVKGSRVTGRKLILQ